MSLTWRDKTGAADADAKRSGTEILSTADDGAWSKSTWSSPTRDDEHQCGLRHSGSGSVGPLFAVPENGSI